MLKNRNGMSSAKGSGRLVRPISAGTCGPKKSGISFQINKIISSLEKNVKDLKSYYQNRQQSKGNTLSLQKSRTNFRLKRVLHRNGSQTNLNKMKSSHNEIVHHSDNLPSDVIDKTICDVFEIKNYFMKVHGRQTNNIVQLYEFYKKNIEKRDKSTRILASIDMSNGHSLEVCRQSLRQDPSILHKEGKREVKQQRKVSYKLPQSQKFDISSKLQNTSNLNKTSLKSERPSSLASDLLSKGLFSVANVANLMMNKKYRLTKEKQQSFQIAKLQRPKINSLKLQPPKENTPNLINSEYLKLEADPPKEVFQMNYLLEKQQLIAELKSNEQSQRNQLNENASFNQPQYSILVSSSPIKEKHVEKQQFQVSSIKKIFQPIKVDEPLKLEESPIAPKEGKFFSTSKYYVQPIPIQRKIQKKDDIEQKSITLKSSSRIIDVELLSFDL